MTEEVKPVEAAAQSAGSEQKPVQQDDWELKYKEQTERLAKAEEAARNYKTGMLKYKKAVRTDEVQPDEGTIDSVELMRQVAREELMGSTVEQERKNLENMNLQMARELKEAKLALANRSSKSPAQGANITETVVPDNSISPEKLAAVSARFKGDAKKIEAWKQNRLRG